MNPFSPLFSPSRLSHAHNPPTAPTHTPFLPNQHESTHPSIQRSKIYSAMSLADHLLGVVTNTTAAYQELQDKETRLSTDLSLAQAQLFPLRKDNSRLTRENHQLHVDNIRQTDAAANMFAEQNVNIRQLQDDVAELNLVLKMKEEKCQRVELEKERLREAYEELADPTMKAAKGTKRMMKTSSMLPPRAPGDTGSVDSGSVGISGQHASALVRSSTDAGLIESLRHQLDEANATLKHSSDEISRLTTAVNAREMELARSTRASDLEDTGTSKAEQLASADASNKRIIDQLNGQVDFLNEQLALREAQLVESAAKIIRADEVQLEFSTKSNMVDTLRTQINELTSKLRNSERKVNELTEALDPEGDVSVDELFANTSTHSAKNMMNLLYSENDQNTSNTSVNRSASSSGSKNTARGSVPMPEMTRSGRRPPKNLDTSEDISAAAKALAEREAKLVAAQRKISTSRAPAGGIDSVLTKREHDTIVSQLLAEKQGLMDDIKDLHAQINDSTGGANLYKERMRRGEEKLASLKVDLDEAQSQAEMLARQVQQKDEYLSIRETECNELQRKLQEISSKLGSNTHTSSELEWKVNHLQAQFDESCRERDTAQTLAERLRVEISTLRRERIDVISAKEEIEGKLRMMTRDYNSSQAAADKANREVLEVKTQHVNLTVKFETLVSEHEASQRKLDHTTGMFTQTQSNLNTIKGELTEALNSLAMYQMSSAPGNAADVLRNDLRAMTAKCNSLDNDNKELHKERINLQEQIHSLTTRNMIGAQSVEQSNSDKSSLLQEIENKTNALLAVAKSAQELELEVERLTTKLKAEEMTVNSLRAAARDKELHSHTQLNTSQQLSSDVTMLTRRCVDAEEAYSIAKRQSEKDQHALIRMTERATNSEREVASLSDMLLTSQQEIDNFQLQTLGLKKQIEVVNRQLAAERSDSNMASEHEDAMNKKIQDLKTLLANNEASVRSQALKNTQLLNVINQSEENTQRLDVEMNALKTTILEKNNKIESLQEALKNLDGGRDDVQNQLDMEQERSVKQDTVIRQLEQKNLQLRQVLEQTDKKFSNSSSELHHAQNTLKGLDQRLNAFKEENGELKRRLGMKNSDVAGAAEDLMLMTKENQALTAELADTSMERDRLRSRITDVVQKMSSLEQSRRALEVERTDLLDTYRSVLAEKRKLENELNALGAMKQRTGVNVQQMQGAIAELKGMVQAHGITEKRWAVERASQLKQLETFNDELVRARNSIESVEADNRRLMQDTHGLRQTNTMLNERVQMVIKRATTAADANKVLSTRLSSVERERDAVRALVNAERQRAEDYGTIAETARAQVATRELELDRLRSGSPPGTSSGKKAKAPVHGHVNVAATGSVASSSAPSSNTGGSSASSAAAAAAAVALNMTLGLSEDDSMGTPPHIHND